MTAPRHLSSTIVLKTQKAITSGRFKLALAAAVVLTMLIPVVIAIHAGVYDSWFDNPLSSFGMWGVFVIYLWTRPHPKESLLVFCLAVILRITHWLAANEYPYPGYSVINIGVYLPCFCLPILVYRSFKGPQQSSHRLSLGGVLLLSYIGVFLAYYTSFAKIVCHYKLDYLLYSFDGTLGSHVNFMIGKAVSTSEPLRIVLDTTYNSLGFFVALMVAVHISLANNKLNILKLNIANSIIGFSLYFLYPAMGPKYAFSSFPQLPGTVPLSAAVLDGVPNAMPSLHFATTLLIFFIARPWKWLRWITGVYLGAMLFAVFGTGEHYMVDTIVAIPYALMIMALASNTHERKRVLNLSVGMLTLWLLVLRFGAFEFWTSWGLVLTTIGTGFVMERRFAKGLWSVVNAAPESVRLSATYRLPVS